MGSVTRPRQVAKRGAAEGAKMVAARARARQDAEELAETVGAAMQTVLKGS